MEPIVVLDAEAKIGVAASRLAPFLTAIDASALPIAIADARGVDTPLVFVNDAFLSMTGYSATEVLGRNCRFLQGPETQDKHRQAIGFALRTGATVSQEILNYRKDGTTFWNELHMAPMQDASGTLVYFVATQVDVTARVHREAQLQHDLAKSTLELREQSEEAQHLAQEMAHRVRNSMTLAYAMMRLQLGSANESSVRDALDMALGRMGAIVEIQRLIEKSAKGEDSKFDELLTAICLRMSELTDITVTVDIEDVDIAMNQLTPIALIVTELLTNAIKHAFNENALRKAIIVIASVEKATSTLRVAVRDNGHGIGQSLDRHKREGFGNVLLKRQANALQATLNYTTDERGTEAVLLIPLIGP